MKTKLEVYWKSLWPFRWILVVVMLAILYLVAIAGYSEANKIGDKYYITLYSWFFYVVPIFIFILDFFVGFGWRGVYEQVKEDKFQYELEVGDICSIQSSVTLHKVKVISLDNLTAKVEVTVNRSTLIKSI